MSLLTRVKIWGLVATAIVGATWIYLFDPLTTQDKDWPLITLTVTFEPRERHAPVQILVKINGSPAINEPAYESPWQETTTAPRGSLVMLIATQRTQQLILQCSITVRGKTTGPSGIEPQPDGTSNCAVAATA